MSSSSPYVDSDERINISQRNGDDRLLDLQKLVNGIFEAEDAVKSRFHTLASKWEEAEKENSGQRPENDDIGGGASRAPAFLHHALDDPVHLMRRLDSLHERVDVLRRASGRIVDRHLAAQREVAAKLLANQQILDSIFPVIPQSIATMDETMDDTRTTTAGFIQTKELCSVVQRHLHQLVDHD